MRLQSSGRLLIATVGILLAATLWREKGDWLSVAIAQEAKNTAERRPLVLDRAPVRMVSDPNPVFSGIAIDTERGEVFMTNDKECAHPSVVVYPIQFRQDAIFVFRSDVGGDVAPIRIIHGPKTRLDRPVRVSVDPINHLLAAATATCLWIFDRTANGDVAPMWVIEGPKNGAEVGKPHPKNPCSIRKEKRSSPADKSS